MIVCSIFFTTTRMFFLRDKLRGKKIITDMHSFMSRNVPRATYAKCKPVSRTKSLVEYSKVLTHNQTILYD
jgi:hypothetical protein